MTNKAKRLIEVALPVKEISSESVRDKSIRHGHISTLHLWWARRPLPVCRAVVFASLVPDPDDENCPDEFRKAVEVLLGPIPQIGDVYKPYKEIPYTAGEDLMEDTLRNRLLMFIGKFSDEFIDNQKRGKKTEARKIIAGHSLIKWESRHSEEILNRARKLIWVAHDPANNTLAEFDRRWQNIKNAEKALYETSDRHIESDDVKKKQDALDNALSAFLSRMPRVYDPFAGGGAIPLEAARLGCRSFANDYNPVAFVIEKGSLEFPQKFGKPIVYSRDEFIKRYGEDELEKLYADDPMLRQRDNIKIENRLAFDVEFYSKKLISMAEEEIGHYYPADDKGNKPVAYYWARVARCGNPSCGADVPLLRDFYMVNKTNKKIYLKPVIKGKDIFFEVAKGKHNFKGWNYRGNLTCPCCSNVTDVNKIKEQKIGDAKQSKILAVIWESNNGKIYSLPRDIDINALKEIPDTVEEYRPNENMQRNSAGGDTFSWGVSVWGQMFSNRQLLAMQTFVEKMNQIKQEMKGDDGLFDEYDEAVVCYLGILVDRVATRITSFGVLNTKAETFEHPFGRQAIPMVFDYPEPNPFSRSGGGALSQTDWLIRYIEGESIAQPFASVINSSSAEQQHFEKKSVPAVITDPPYFDAIAYADLADFFYVWLKRTMSDVYPEVIAYPQTPKSDECTALKHHHNNDATEANSHFEDKLKLIMNKIEEQTSGVVSIMFAHQSTEAWTTLCNSILSSGMNITSSWAADSERIFALKKDKAFLGSAITVTCSPATQGGTGDFRTVQKEIETKIKSEVKTLLNLGFRGADLLTACFGPAVSVFGKYQSVEKADGSKVTVAELLEIARDAAFHAIVSDIEADDTTSFYIGWLNLFGFDNASHDDVRRITQVGLNIDVDDLIHQNILERQGNVESLIPGIGRISANLKIGEKSESPVIDRVHRAMSLYSGSRDTLLEYIAKTAPQGTEPFWRVMAALVEVLPGDSDDYKNASGLLSDKDNIVRAARSIDTGKDEQLGLNM